MYLTEKRMLGILYALNWGGHVELPDPDMLWLARELTNVLDTSNKRGTCEACGSRADIVLTTTLGTICEACIEEFGKAIEEDRKALEDADDS